jgi:hypothetical protein
MLLTIRVELFYRAEKSCRHAAKVESAEPESKRPELGLMKLLPALIMLQKNVTFYCMGNIASTGTTSNSSASFPLCS